jgi:competence protein ComEA
MLFSMIIRLAMVAATTSVVLWIGWTLPSSQFLNSDEIPPLDQPDTNGLGSTDRLRRSQTGFEAVPKRPQSRSSHPSVPRTIDLNLASERDLEGLPGIGPILALRIVEYREARGAFRDVEQLRRVKGIGKKTVDRIRPLVHVTSSLSMQPRVKVA